MDTSKPPDPLAKIAMDLNKVNNAVWTVGGMMANKPPDMDAMKQRKGCLLYTSPSPRD